MTSGPVMTPGLDADALAGWPRDPKERMDFYHRSRSFPPDVAVWRQWLIRRLVEDSRLFPGVRAFHDEKTVRERLDEGIIFVREVARILAAVHLSPRLGNKEEPVDELVYIILARKTREDAYQRTFDTLKRRFPTWDDLLASSPRAVSRLIHGGGLEAKKTQSLLGALRRLRDTFGKCTLEPARNWPDERLEEFLCSLPEISRKSAYCIMMYSFGRAVFPVDTHVGRMLTRLGPYREIGLKLHGLDHKQLQKVLADLVPPNLRYSLHVNLVAHGRACCKSIGPLCGECQVRNLCSFYRRREALHAKGPGRPTVADLFCGAGGLSEGFKRAGFRVALALDSDPMSLRTYTLNHPEVPESGALLRDVRELRTGDLRRAAGGRGVDVLVAAPPCQGFSHAGFRSKGSRTGYRLSADHRNFLFEYVVMAARELRPKLVLMENVPGMESARRDNLSFVELAARKLQRAGYRTTIWRLNASAFGVPQERIRYFLAASRLGRLPDAPAEEYQDMQRAFEVDALPPVTLDEAIFDLPPREAEEGTAVERWPSPASTSGPRSRRYLTKFGLLRQSGLLYNHAVRYHNPRDLELYALLRPGEDSVHALERHGRADLMRYRRDVFDDKYARLRSDRPSKTMVAHLAKDGNSYIHPHQVRSISIRESARLQSFHDEYVFCGSPSDQWIQIGNAVPPVLAEAVARSFMQLLMSGRKR
jgi:DNA (cytosine-5)-methyltransferase 1